MTDYNLFTILTGFQRDILNIIYNIKEPTFIQIRKEIEEKYDTEILSRSLLKNVNILERNNFIQIEQKEEENHYKITMKGEKTINEYINFIN